MYKWEKPMREDRYKPERKNPSFSSSLLDEIYRSIDDGSTKSPDLRFYRETMQKKQGKYSNKTIQEEQKMSSLHRAGLIEKWIEKKVNEKSNINKQRHFSAEYDRKSSHHHQDHDQDQDGLFFSSTSASSNSSSGEFSSSDTDSLYATATATARSSSRSSCFVSSRPKPVRTNISSTTQPPRKTERSRKSLFYEQEMHVFDDYQYHHYNSATDYNTRNDEETLIKSKSRALKIYGNLKKMKQPISPGGRLASFINSMFTNTKKSKTSFDDLNIERNSKSAQVSTCSTASSFSRSCLSKNSPSTRERLRNGVKRNVRFYPVSVIVDEDCKPIGHKSLYGEEDATPASRKKEEDRVKELAREVLKDYHQNQKKNDLIMRDIHIHTTNYDDDDDDDAASYSSSDLFELDHLAVIGNNNNSHRYSEELPVYETTHVRTNRAIANGLI